MNRRVITWLVSMFAIASAKPVWAELLGRLDEPDLDVRVGTTNALCRINPDAARQIGIQ